MPLSGRTKTAIQYALADGASAKELIDAVNAASGSGPAPSTAITNITVTPTTGTLPTANGAITIADTATPTVVELLEYCTELRAKQVAINAVLLAQGLTA